MRKKVFVYILTMILVFMTALVAQSSNSYPMNGGEENKLQINSKIYAAHDRISIAGNDQFLTTAGNEGWSGTGDSGNPIIIDGYSIAHSSTDHFGIFMEDTTLHFEIKNNYLYGTDSDSWCGIHVENITNGKFIDNEFYFGYNGLFLSDASNFEITGNYMHDNFLQGISVTGSDNIDIINNEISGNLFNGIHFFDTEFGTITGNYILNNSRIGINFATTSHGCVIKDNIISGNSQGGISYYRSDNLVIINNSVHNNNDHGIIVSRSLDGNITNNSIMQNGGFGIIVTSNSHDNAIRWNNFTDNNIGGVSQARNDGNNNIFVGNYWSDWDGVEPYYIAYHDLAEPNITYPSGGETISGVINIHWQSAIDGVGHSLAYSVHYSSDNGSTWIPIDEGIGGTNAMWDTTDLDDGDSYLIKVAAECSEGLAGESQITSCFEISNVDPSSTSQTSTGTTQESSSTASGWLFPGVIMALLLLPVIQRAKKKNR